MCSVSPEAIESVQQLTATWRTFVLDCGTGEVSDPPGMAIRWADGKFPFWNCITFTDQDCDSRLLDQRFSAAIAYMRARTRPGLIWLFDDLLDADAQTGLPAAAERGGLSLLFPGFGMVGDLLPIAEPHHPKLDFVRVTTIATGNCLFLALVATAPEAQRKGYGEATVRKALFEGGRATGLTRTVLHATPAGAAVYERIGYRKVASISFYGLKD